MVTTFDLLGVHIAATDLHTAAHVILDWVAQRRQTYVCCAPVATIVEAYREPAYRQVINAAGMTTPDGMPVALLGRLRGHREMQRTHGSGLMYLVCDLGQQHGIRHYFYGGNGRSNERLVRNLRQAFPHLIVAGQYVPPALQVHEPERHEILEQINRARPDILWIGLGAPKQEFWMAQHRGQLCVPVMIGVGAAFDFLAGTKPRAPDWMQRTGLEWLFRLCCEPRRLWKRYLIGNAQFIYFLLKDALTRV